MAVYRFRKEELEGHLNKNALWAIVYGDMMSYLMILFLLMLSYQISANLKLEKQTPIEQTLSDIQRVFGGKVDPKVAARAQQEDKEMLISHLLRAKAEGGQLGASTHIIVSEQRIAVQLGEGVLFDSGKADLKPTALPVLASVAKDLVKVKNEIRVEGHTDNVPIHRGPYKSNWELSMARAYAVIRQLQEDGVAPQRLSGLGYGEYRPLASNATPEGRAKNRRIEISLLREQ